MKKILISQRLISNQNYFEIREALDVKWGALFKKLNFLPVILPIEFGYKKYFETLKIDGIVLTGGNSLNSLGNDELSNRRDSFEKKLIKYGVVNKIPIFGVCRGMQIIAEYFGANFKKVKGQIGIKHRLKINKKSKYCKELNKLVTVNSFHNYAINSLPKSITISATNKDGMIKAIEHNRYKIFAQMWHSERDSFFNKDQINLFKKFF